MEYPGNNNETTMTGNTKATYSKKVVNAIPGRLKFRKLKDILKKK